MLQVACGNVACRKVLQQLIETTHAIQSNTSMQRQWMSNENVGSCSVGCTCVNCCLACRVNLHWYPGYLGLSFIEMGITPV
jgi:hypothetical protein